MSLKYLTGKLLLCIPGIKYSQWLYRLLGVKQVSDQCHFFIGNPRVIGSYDNIIMHNNSEIERNCFLLAKERIEIGENTTLAYGVTILTGADPNGPNNKLSQIYPAKKAPVVIGDNCWIGANAIILPGVSIGDCCVVAAGAVVTKDVPAGVMVAGNPAIIKKQLQFE